VLEYFKDVPGLSKAYVVERALAIASAIVWDYHGCLRIGVHRSSVLLRKIEGWAEAIMADPTGDEGQVSNPPS
jgi:hypothetical protein